MGKDKKFDVVLLRGTTRISKTVFANDRNEAIKEAKDSTSQGYLAKVVSAKVVEAVVNGKWVKK